MSVLVAVHQLEERDGCQVLGNMAAMDIDGFSLEEVEGSEVEEGEEIPTGEGDGDFSEKQVIFKSSVFVNHLTGWGDNVSV